MLVCTLSASRLGVLAATVLAAFILPPGPVCAQPPASDAAVRRLALLEIKKPDAKAVGRIAGALGDKDPVVARTAARLLVRYGKADLPALRRALGHRDMLVRRTVTVGLGDKGPEAIDLLATALRDDHVFVRQAAVVALGRIRPRSERLLELLDEAAKDEDGGVREAALDVSRSFFRRLDEIGLPKAGWKFRLDPDRIGEEEKWFAAEYEDSGWNDIEIEQAWQLLGYDYIGTAWYRRTIELPERPKPGKVELAFEGVDESAWVWVNGSYAGEHDIGPSGWDKPFNLDVTDLLVWGQENQITVRAMNTAARGGIWRPITIVLLELEK
jgi:hypothetical protein